MTNEKIKEQSTGIAIQSSYDTDEYTINSQSSKGSGGYLHKIILRYKFTVDPDNRTYTIWAREQFYHAVTDDNWVCSSPYNRLIIDGTEKCKTTNNLGSVSGSGTIDLCPSFKGSSWQNMGTFNYDVNGKGNTHSVGVSCGYSSSWAGISRKTTYHDITPPSINPGVNVLNSVANFNISDGFTPNITSYGLNSYMSIDNVTDGYEYAVSNGTSCKLTDSHKNTIISLLGSTNNVALNFRLQTKNGNTEIGTSGPVQATCFVPVTTFTVTKDSLVQGKYNFLRTNYGLYDTITVMFGSTIIRNETAYTDSITLTSEELSNIYNLMSSTSEDLTFKFKTYKDSQKTYLYQDTDKVANISMADYSPTITLTSYSDSITDYDNYKNNSTDIIASLSKPKIIVTLSNNNNNTYKSVTCNGVEGTIILNERIVTFTDIVQANEYKIVATDNRGKVGNATFTGSKYTSNIKTVPWIKPSVNTIQIKRPDGPVGSTVQIIVKGTFYPGGNLKNLKNAILLTQVSFDGTNYADCSNTVSTNGTFDVTINLDSINYKKPVYVRAKITDRIGISTDWTNANIPSGKPVFNTYRDTAGDGYMRINGELNADEQVNLNGSTTIANLTSLGMSADTRKAILNIMYPVGSLFETTSNDFNTVEKVQNWFGGTWEQISGHYLYASTDNPGTTGGSFETDASGDGTTGSTTLTIEQMPSHGHNVSVESSGAHTHDVKGGASTGGSSAGLESYGSNYKTFRTISGAAYSNGAHKHDVTQNDVGGGQGHAHTLDSHTHHFEPPRYNMYCFRRIS